MSLNSKVVSTHFSWWSWSELKIVLLLALPLVIGQLAQTGMGFVDTVMAGQVSAEDLAGVALGSAVWLPIYLFATGILLLLTPKIARAVGRESQEEITVHLWHASVLAFALAGVVSLALFSSGEWLKLFELEQKVYEVSRDYLYALAYGIWFALGFQVIRFFYDGFGVTHYSMILAIIGFLVNIPLNYVFIYGWWIFPEMGGAGCGVATSLSYLMMMLVGWLWFYFSPRYHRFYLFWQHKISLSIIKSWFVNGVPIAASILFEVGLFILIAFLLTPLGTTVLAAHQIAISYTSMVFMLPMSLAMAMTVRVGFLHGKENLSLLKQSILTLLTFSILLGIVLSVFTAVLSQDIANLYTNSSEVLEIASVLILYAAAYQISDAIQVFSSGVLRGLVDTMTIMWVTLFSYWMIALPLGYWFCYGLGIGVAGFWMSFVIGLTLAAIGLWARVYIRVWRYGL